MSKPIDSADYPFQLSESEWRERLAPDEYAVLRNQGTERAGTGELLDEERDGLYRCRACSNELFVAGTKFDSGCGWPSFYESVRPGAVELLEDRSLGMVRTEVRCARCGSHLGHVFPDGFGTPTGDRYCMNSLSLSFEPGAQPGEPGAERDDA
ncbi:peptide-methionine (R)-S-oxide reductase MsrB [Leucobacter chromiiresistens]|uniref:peptide-methionine (R)-S-oxide reductase n=1 Tax=Leucobacter chromiiresistens TaxID=1079994 RepID=A0A1H0XS63_9MICO|nr:peptide-methionine (R)-S-oxide reductase MsrB [Leucobacter chromiiresistens]SDQ05752.1 peptide-methionine (R)-S-oxide reductase [Leucobacter chromiiresistens]